MVNGEEDEDSSSVKKAEADAESEEELPPSQRTGWAREHPVLLGLLLTAVGILGSLFVTRLSVRQDRGILSPFDIGGFEITVRSFTCRDVDLEPFIFASQAQGKYCVAVATALNKSKEAQTVSLLDWGVRVADERYPSVDDAGRAVSRDVFPGSKGSVLVLFDIPVEGVPTGLVVAYPYGGFLGIGKTVEIRLPH